MQIQISSMIAENLPLSQEEAQLVDELIPVKTFSKGHLLLEEGQVARRCFFLIEGCVRSFQLLDGVEHTTAIYLEEDSIASMDSYLQQKPANHYLECLETSTLAVLPFDNEKKLYQRIPQLESLCRDYMEAAFAAQQAHYASLLLFSAELRYKKIMETQPKLIHRVPQYILASYLGIKAESLSRIRKRIAKDI